MGSLVDGIRTVIGPPDFYVDGAWNVGALFEYIVCSLVLLVCVSSVFKILVGVFRR